MRRAVIALVTVAIGAGIGGWFVLSNTPEEADASTPTEAARRPPSVTVARAETREIAEEVHVSGSLVAREEVMVAPEVEGLAVTEILVEEGDHVEQGQALARLSRSAIDAEAAQASAAIAQSRASIAEAEATVLETKQALQRSETLRKSGTASAQQYDQALSASQVADARLNAAKENLKVAEAQRDQVEVRRARTEIKAPSAGIVKRRNLRLGAIASMAAEPAFRLIEDGDIELEAQVVDVTLARLKPQQIVRVTPAGSNDVIQGQIRLISPEIDATTRLGRVRVALPDSADVSVGSFASGLVEIGRHTALTVPTSAITVDEGKNFVQVVTDGKVRTQEVQLGLRAPTRVEVKNGLAEGDEVVARAGSFLRDGDAVTPVEPNVAEGVRK